MLQAQATVHPIEAGNNQISAVISQLAAGDTLHLVTPNGVYHETDNIDLPPIPLTIIGHPDKHPIWTVSGTRQLGIYDAISIQGIQFDGNNAASSALRIHTPPKTVLINNCKFHSFLQDAITEQSGTIGTLIVRNSIFYNIAQTALEFKTPDSCEELIVENCTFYDIGEKAIHLNAEVLQIHVRLKNLTIHKCVGGIWVENVHSGEITNCIVTNCRSYGIRVIPTNSPIKITYTCAYNNQRPYGETKPDVGCIETNPFYLDADMGDFSLRSISPSLTASQNKTPIGDLRWTGAATSIADRNYMIQTFGPISLAMLLLAAIGYLIYRITHWHLHERAEHHALQQSQAILETNVVERTRELKEANNQLQIEISQRQQIEHALREAHNTLEKQMDERNQELVIIRDDLQIRNEQLQQAQKLEAVGQLASGIAHDFNNNLAVIRGYIDMALEQVTPNASLHRYLSQVNDAVQRSARLTGQLLIFSSKQPIEPQTIDLNQNILELEDMLSRVLGEHITTQLDLEENIWPVVADTGNVDQIITNLGLNARDAMPDGGILKISTHNKQVQNPIQPDISPGQYVCISVSDTGIGMNSEVQSHLFEPFYTTKEKEKGTGLGLAVVYGIVHAHQGWIDVTSEIGKGSTFDIYLPMEEDFLQTLPQTETEMANLNGNGERILFIEDDPALRDIKRSILETHNYHVQSCASCVEARETFIQNKGQFDLIFSDIVLPDGYGTDLVFELTQNNPQIAVVLITGHIGDRADWNTAREAGWPILQKPIPTNDLLSEIHKALHSQS
ncbi:MAG: response regulator [Candidatus Latescibacteria bacterium]|nr:response regulator [Candidatus Latescibacterota bacterium]